MALFALPLRALTLSYVPSTNVRAPNPHAPESLRCVTFKRLAGSSRICSYDRMSRRRDDPNRAQLLFTRACAALSPARRDQGGLLPRASVVAWSSSEQRGRQQLSHGGSLRRHPRSSPE